MKVVDGKQIFSVGEINNLGKQALEQVAVWVEGEISSFQQNPAWFNVFLTLSDGTNLLECFTRPTNLEGLTPPLEGQKVMAFGRLTLFRKNQYKMEIHSVKPTGDGILQKKFEELFKKMKAEGLFDEDRKKLLPEYPHKICVVTSEGSAGWNDFKAHTVDKFPIIELYTADVRVEGARAVSQLLKILPEIDQKGFDVIVITRGGGSSESLLEVFNDELVARTIFAMKTPKVVAIGHEINVSLAELVADKRASTPTDAANIVAAGYNTALGKLAHYHFRFTSTLQRLFSENSQALDSYFFRLNQVWRNFKDLPYKLSAAKESLRRHEKRLISGADQRIDDLMRQIKKEILQQLINQNQKVQGLEKSMYLLSPTNTLSRGYSITTDEKGRVLKTTKGIVVGNIIGVKLAEGNLTSEVLTKSDEK